MSPSVRDLPDPAYSTPFSDSGLKQLSPFRPFEEITPEGAWGGSTGKGVKVAVVDSGVDASHPAVLRVAGYVKIEQDVDQTLKVDTAAHEDCYGHGTACAGIIRSLAPDCDIYSVRVLGPMLTGRGAVFAEAIRWCIDNEMNVVSMSLTTQKKEFVAILHELADEAYFRNIMLVTAANNIPVPSFPALFASVFSVASHDESDPEMYFYNPSPPVEFGAHGIDVRVAWRGGGYMVSTGNSFAAPHIAGIIARILGRHPGLTPFQVKFILRALAANVRGAYEPSAAGSAS